MASRTLSHPVAAALQPLFKPVSPQTLSECRPSFFRTGPLTTRISAFGRDAASFPLKAVFRSSPQPKGHEIPACDSEMKFPAVKLASCKSSLLHHRKLRHHTPKAQCHCILIFVISRNHSPQINRFSQIFCKWSGGGKRRCDGVTNATRRHEQLDIRTWIDRGRHNPRGNRRGVVHKQLRKCKHLGLGYLPYGGCQIIRTAPRTATRGKLVPPTARALSYTLQHKRVNSAAWSQPK